MSQKILEGLTPAQKDAILYGNGPLLVLAGAGSGKTKVIAHRVAHLVGKSSLNGILTVTFTNKSADEMRQRIASLIKKDMQDAWIGTFHSQCSKILRREIQLLGFSSDFSILDESDQSSLIRHILKEFKIYEALYKGVLSRISFLKTSLIGPKEFLSKGDVFGFEDKLARVYVRYQDELRKSNALDFDDLIVFTIKLFEEYPKVLKKYQGLFHHILVDEFQDTNHAQYRLLKLLSGSHGNIFAVGDDDQSIYGFRGAEIANIMNFKKDFPKAKVIKLEQNYRSTQHILNSAHNIINKNTVRHPKRLFTDRKQGDKVYLCSFDTEQEESRFIAKTIRELYLKGIYSYRDFAVLYRVNLQSKTIEETMRNERLPYYIVGSVGFYQKKEIKDLIAYMKLVLNPHNNVCLRRIINCPPRGIGQSTLSKIEQVAKKKTISLFDGIKELLRTNNTTSAIKEGFQAFVDLIETASLKKFKDVGDMLGHIHNLSGYEDFVDDERSQNVRELIAGGEGITIKEFIDKVSMLTNLDDVNKDNAVSLMTLHTAKGLEFPAVFISGLEEGIMPYFKAKDNKELEEERRLLYVGMTRAKDILYLTCAKKRRLYAKIQEQQPSRFLKDIPIGCCHKIEAMPSTVARKVFGEKVKVFKFFTYVVGSRVKHPTWGVGVVRDCSGEGDDQKITVNFPNIGVKRLAMKFANLQKL
ncbi:MAG: DUF3553 domain-containing protein [Nitrospirae bacterium]|nr:DUF3553 domain-containing protein [Nitrospirota bacterium]